MFNRMCLVIVPCLAVSAGAANLVANGDFEAGSVAGGGHAFTPAPWTSTMPGISTTNWDTWENSGTTGLPPSFAGVFTGATAPQGIRWAGGWDFEEMGQLLSAPLTPGQQYNTSAIVRPGYTMTGGLELWIGTGPGTPVSLLHTFPLATAGAWTAQSGTFVAPANALANPWFILKAYTVPGAQIYLGVDDVFVDVVPAPGSAGLLAAAGLGGLRRRRATA